MDQKIITELGHMHYQIIRLTYIIESLQKELAALKVPETRGEIHNVD